MVVGGGLVVGEGTEVEVAVGLVVGLVDDVDDVDDELIPPTRRTAIRTNTPMRTVALSTGSRWTGRSGV